MRRLLGWAGIGAFWMLWPVWWLYFKRSGRRSRVLVVCGDEVLLHRGVLSSSAKLSVLGGGQNKGESATAAAVRELQEEIGLQVAETTLQPLGSHQHQASGFRYDEDYFLLELTEKPLLTIHASEILFARWYPLSGNVLPKLQTDARFALQQYRAGVRNT